MVTARLKSPDKNEVCKKVLGLLKKQYPSAAPRPEAPVLETMLYGICLENCSVPQADDLYARLHNGFHDFNEVRVSSIFELEDLFRDVHEPEWKALRVKNSLQYVFEATYSFDFEGLKRKTIELATKQLGKIKSLSAFVRSYVLQNSLGSHVLPVDVPMHNALKWLVLAEADSTPEAAGDSLRSFVRKADAQLFCVLLRCLGTDQRLAPGLVLPADPEQQESFAVTAVSRLEHLLRHGPTPPKKETARKVGAEKLSTTVKARGTATRAAAGGSTARKSAPAASKPAPARNAKSSKPEKGTKKVVTAKQSTRPAAKKKPK